MDDLFAFRNGQDCEIFKATRFERSDDIIYIPDLALNLIPVTEPANGPEDVEEIVGCCYTGNDFVEECGGGKTPVLVLRLAASEFSSARNRRR